MFVPPLMTDPQVKDMDKELTPIQKQYVKNYTDPTKESFLVGAKAYREASPTASPNTARTESSKLLKKPEIRTAIERAF